MLDKSIDKIEAAESFKTHANEKVRVAALEFLVILR